MKGDQKNSFRFDINSDFAFKNACFHKDKQVALKTVGYYSLHSYIQEHVHVSRHDCLALNRFHSKG